MTQRKQKPHSTNWVKPAKISATKSSEKGDKISSLINSRKCKLWIRCKKPCIWIVRFKKQNWACVNKNTIFQLDIAEERIYELKDRSEEIPSKETLRIGKEKLGSMGM